MITCSIIQKSQLESAYRLDAGYYQPEYLELQERIYATGSYKIWKDIQGRFITGPFGSEFKVDNYIPDAEYRYVRGKDVKKFFLTSDDNVYIHKKDYERLKKYSLKEGDILVSVVGTLGNAIIVDGSVLPAIFSCKSTAFRTDAIDPYYFIAYLNSRYGQKLLERSVRGAVQTGLNIDDLKSLPVFVPIEKEQELIATIVLRAKQEQDKSKLLYSQAKNLLLEELELKDFEPEDELSYIVKLSDIKSAHRADAAFFQPKYGKALERIEEKNVISIGDLVSIKKGVEPGSGEYRDEGKLFIRVSNLSKHGIIDKNQKYLNDELYQRLQRDFEPKTGEILLTKDATPGIAYVLKEPLECIIAGGILRLKLKEDVEIEYLALCINSTICQMQIERDASGSVISHWKPEQIKKLQIPILPKPTQKKIADLVIQSHQARKKAKGLLEKAKRKVEEFIEGK
jgi:restriction endonuclease S subunit